MQSVVVDRGDRAEVGFLSLEITGRCQLNCLHCYADSGPWRDHGTMGCNDWKSVIDQATYLGCSEVQFIGGEPSLHPDLTVLMRHALGYGLGVEVFSNLVRVPDALWDVFSLPGVRLATSYYSSDATEHNAITRHRSHGRTLWNIREAVRRSIPLRLGVIGIADGQDLDKAVGELRELGISNIGIDYLRQIGRGARNQPHGIDQLCGRCGHGQLAVLPSGDVTPCTLSRWMRVGNVHEAPLALIHQRADRALRELHNAFASRPGEDDGGCAAPVCFPHLSCKPKG